MNSLIFFELLLTELLEKSFIVSYLSSAINLFKSKPPVKPVAPKMMAVFDIIYLNLVN